MNDDLLEKFTVLKEIPTASRRLAVGTKVSEADIDGTVTLETWQRLGYLEGEPAKITASIKRKRAAAAEKAKPTKAELANADPIPAVPFDPTGPSEPQPTPYEPPTPSDGADA